ncbi:MAG TPA: condensation domain-containing protein, partial [Acidobacteriota bacterium]|nr:condensation domain-containing protein [Acidobacteriota bacterium]
TSSARRLQPDVFSPTSSALQDFLKSKLPDFMQPAAIVVLDKLPLAAQGKVALKALPAPEYGAMGPASAHTIPTTPTEELIAQIWAEVLGRDSVPIDAGFFELGGHSLLAVRVLARMRDAFQVELPLRRLFEVQTVTGIAAVIDELVAQHRRGEPLNQRVPPPLVAGPRPDQLPLSFSQERFWFLDQLEPGNTFYLVPAALHLRGELSLPALERAFQEVARRHEDLRTVFRIVDSQPAQVIFPEWPWGEIVRFESVSDRETAIRSVRADIKRPFDLANGPMLRVKVLQFTPQDWILLIVLHHTVADGWSLNVLTREVAQLYSAFVREEQKNLPPLPVQYADYALWQRNWFSGEVLQDQLSFWTKTLGNAAKVLELPTDFPRPAIQEYRGANQRIEFPPELTQALRALSRREGVTLFMTLLAGFHLLLHRYAGQEDVLIGTPVAGRNRREIEGLIGVFVNILVLHARLSADLSFRDLLKQVRETTLDAFAHQDLPFEQLLEALHLPRDLSRSPLFQVFFVYQNAFTPLNLNLKLGELELIPFRNSGDVISGVSRYDLSLFVVETRDSVRFVFQYSTALFQAETIQRMMGHFQTLFESVVANPTAPVSELNLLTAAEREQLLVQWNATQAEYPAHLCLHQLVEQQVEQTPDAIAVRFGTQQLTYRELNLRAEILAAELGLQDIGPGDRVGVCLERGLEMLVAVLGILKSGAAYVPLDPAFPTERLELIITDAQLAAILTQFSVVDRLPVIDTHLLYVDDLDWRQNSGTRNPEPEKPGFRVPGSGFRLSESTISDQMNIHESKDFHEGFEELSTLSTVEPGTRNPEPGTRNPDSPAYVIYTSGSTGRPKGVVIPHRAVVNFLCSMQRQPGLTPQDRLLAVTTLSFDIAGLELFLPLVTGACVVIASQDAVRDGMQLAQLLSDESITEMQATPATWKLLLESG